MHLNFSLLFQSVSLSEWKIGSMKIHFGANIFAMSGEYGIYTLNKQILNARETPQIKKKSRIFGEQKKKFFFPLTNCPKLWFHALFLPKVAVVFLHFAALLFSWLFIQIEAGKKNSRKKSRKESLNLLPLWRCGYLVWISYLYGEYSTNSNIPKFEHAHSKAFLRSTVRQRWRNGSIIHYEMTQSYKIPYEMT